MNAFEGFLKHVGALMGLATFGLALACSAMAGVDPFWAVLRAAASTVVLLVLYSTLCSILIPLAKTLGDSQDGAEPKR